MTAAFVSRVALSRHERMRALPAFRVPASLLGWTLLVSAIFRGRCLRPRSQAVATGFALTFVVISVMLYCDRDVAPIFGHISELAGTPRR